MKSFLSLSGQASRLLCVCALMAFTVSIFAQEGEKKWGDMLVERKEEITLRLQKPGDKIVIAGDSHAAFTAHASTCGANVVNAGASGATSARYLELLDSVRFADKVQRTVLLIGTNDTLKKRGTTAAEFRSNAEKIVWKLSRVSERVTVSAIPPISPSKVQAFDDAKATEFSSILSGICDRFSNCSFSDPHRNYRTPERPGASSSDAYTTADGVHLSEYAALGANLAICSQPYSAANLEQFRAK